jgi:5-methylcytosine-specific restriction endonuclease McrA
LPDSDLEERHNRNGCVTDTPGPSPACPGGGGGAARLERRVLIQFSASDGFMAKLEKVRSLAWHQLPANASFEQVFELALDLFIEREDPAMRRERREERDRAATPGKAKTAVSADSSPSERPPADHSHGARHIPAAVRDHVFVRDRGQCTFRSANGRRCASRHALQVDHIRPVARGGPSTPENLRLLCAHHNRLEAVRLMGCSGTRPAT